MKFYVIGDVTVDHLYFLNTIPTAGEEVSPTNSMLLPGGAGGTIAYYLKQLGHEVILAARVGDDPFGELALKNIRQAKIDLSALQQDPHVNTSTITIMMTPDAKRAMISSGGANRNLDAAKLKKKDIETADGLVLSAYSLIGDAQREFAIQAIEIAQKAKVPVFIDLGTGAVNAAGIKLLERVKSADYLLMNQLELLRMTESKSISQALEGLHQRGVNTVIIKVGAMGSIIWTPSETELMEGYKIDGIVDSTGSGDAFTAAFASAMLNNWDIKKAARYANIAGAIVATSIGAQSSLLSDSMLVSHLENKNAKSNHINANTPASPIAISAKTTRKVTQKI